jgi:hypothetical protein
MMAIFAVDAISAMVLLGVLTPLSHSANASILGSLDKGGMQAKQQRLEHLRPDDLTMPQVVPEWGFPTALDIIQDTLKNGHLLEAPRCRIFTHSG